MLGMVSSAGDASAVLSDWLTKHAGNLGDRVVGGWELMATIQVDERARAASCSLPAMMDYADRLASIVLEAVKEPIQR